MVVAGRPFLRVFGAEDYAGSPINSHVVVGRNGFVYVANSLKVLEFDGEHWRQIPQPILAHTSVLVADAEGGIWTSVRGEISELVPDARGLLEFVSRHERLPAAERDPGKLLGGVGTNEGVYVFSSSRLILLRGDGGVKVWPAATRFESMFWMDDALHVTQAGLGLFRVAAEELAPVAAFNRPLPRIFAARASDDVSRWILLTVQGPMMWAGAGSELRPLSDEAEARFEEHPALHALFLAGGRLAFGTSEAGLLVFDSRGRLETQLTKADGLPSNRVNEISEDAEGGVWLAQQSGLARVQLDSPYRYHAGLDGSVRDVAEHEGRFYVAHGEGVSVFEEPGRFRRIDGLPADTPGALTFLRDGDRLLVNASGVREVSPDGLDLLADTVLFSLHPASAVPGAFLGLQHNVNGRGLWVLAPDGERWRTVGKIAGVIDPERFGFDSGDGFFWGTDVQHRVWRADLRGGLRTDAPVTTFELGPVELLTEERFLTVVFRFGSGIGATRDGRIFRFDPATDRFVPETRIEGLPEGLGFHPPEAVGDGSYWFRYSGPGDAGRQRAFGLGDTTRVRLFRVVPVGDDRWGAQEFPAGEIGQLPINKLKHEPVTRKLWIGSTLGLYSANVDWKPARERPPLRVTVRKLETIAGRLIFGGEAVATVQRLQPDERAIRVEFTASRHATDFRGRTGTWYRTRLKQTDRDWTPWTTQTFREFTNLPPGELMLEVQARDAERNESEVATFGFALLAPWWRTGWAYAGYGVLGVLAIGAGVNWRTRALRRKNEALERIVAERTRDLSAKNDELTRLHRLELDERISARLGEEKARLEALRYQLNPHFVFNALTSIRGEIPLSLKVARDAVDRLTDFCRLTLHGPHLGETATVGEEVAMLRAFLDIEQVRLGEFLSVTFDVDPSTEEENVARLLLLPLVENALKYGQVTSPRVLRLAIAVRRCGDRLEFEVANTGEWVERPISRGLPSFGIGHENLRARLRRHAPDRHTFGHEVVDGWVRVRITLPVQRGAV